MEYKNRTKRNCMHYICAIAVLMVLPLVYPCIHYGETGDSILNDGEQRSEVRVSNINALRTSRIDELHPGGASGYDLDGSGVTVGMWDTGVVRSTHEQLMGRTSNQENGTQSNNHSTHVAGVIAANGDGNPDAIGMAPNVNLLCWNDTDSLFEVVDHIDEISVSSHTYDPEYDVRDKSVLFGHYSSTARAIDYIAYNFNHTAVISAGNNQQLTGEDANISGFHSINPIATGKNVITVGSIRDRTNGSVPLGEEWMTDYSSWGPTNDGRIKPDLVANGDQLISTDSESDSAYSEMSGTSFSAPVVTGAIACLTQLYRRSFGEYDPPVAMMKAVLLHTAIDDVDSPGPDYTFGWGLLDARAAADFIYRYSQNEPCMIVDSFQGDAITIPMMRDGTDPIRVTMVWIDPAGNTEIYRSDDEKNLVNDLDLSIQSSDGIYLPWTLDPSNPTLPAKKDQPNHVDTVEQVYISQAGEGHYTITIDGELMRGSSQQYVLCVDGLKPVDEKPEILFLNVCGGTTFHYGYTDGFEDVIFELPIYVKSKNAVEHIQCFADDAALETVQHDEHLYSALLDIRSVPSGELSITATVRDVDGNSVIKTIPVHIIQEPQIEQSGIFISYQELNAGDQKYINELSAQYLNHRYSITITKPGAYRFYTESTGFGSDADTQISLYQDTYFSIGDEIATNDDNGDGKFSSMIVHLNPGVYVLECVPFKHIFGFYGIGFEQATTEMFTDTIPVEVNGSSVSSPFIVEAGKDQWFRFETEPAISPSQYLRGKKYTFSIQSEQPIPGQIEVELFRVIDNQRYYVEGWSQLVSSYRFAEEATYDFRVKLNDYIGLYDLAVTSTHLHPTQEVHADDEPINIMFQDGVTNEAWVVFYPTETAAYRIRVDFKEGNRILQNIQYFEENDRENNQAILYIQNLPNPVVTDKVFKRGDQISFYFFSNNGNGRYEFGIEKLKQENMPIRIRRDFDPELYLEDEPVIVRLYIDIVHEGEISDVSRTFPTAKPGHVLIIQEFPPEFSSFYYDGREYQDSNLFKNISIVEDTVIEYVLYPNQDAIAPFHFFGSATINPSYIDTSFNSSYKTVIEGRQLLDAVPSMIVDWDLY